MEKEQRALETIANEISIACNRAEDQRLALLSITDRVFGSMPQASEESDVKSQPFSEIDQIHIELQRLRHIQDDISSQIERLRNL